MSFPSWTDDPVRDAEAYSDYLDEEAEELPMCDICHSRIYEDHYYEYQGDIICPDCMDNFKVWRD